jgi:hypothetical protein
MAWKKLSPKVNRDSDTRVTALHIIFGTGAVFPGFSWVEFGRCFVA